MGIDSTKKVGFTVGTWDFVHAGHIAHFKECKTYCDYLIVGLKEDPSVDNPEKNKPVMSLQERRKMLKANRFVDLVIIYETEQQLIELEKWLPVDFRFRGADHKGQSHYFTKGKFIDIIGDNSIHSSDIRKRCQKL